MGLLRLLFTGAAVAAGAYYVTKKRPDGTSIADDLKAKAPEWMDKAQPYINQMKEKFEKATGRHYGSANTGSYPQKYDNLSTDPDPTYSS